MARTTKAKMSSKRLPNMSNWTDEQIAEFWETHDSVDYIDEMQEVDVKIDLPEDYRVISLRLEAADIEKAKRLARKKGIPYTILLRMWIKEQMAKISG